MEKEFIHEMNTVQLVHARLTKIPGAIITKLFFAVIYKQSTCLSLASLVYRLPIGLGAYPRVERLKVSLPYFAP